MPLTAAITGTPFHRSALGESGAGTRSSFSRAASLLQRTLSHWGSAQGGKQDGAGCRMSGTLTSCCSSPWAGQGLRRNKQQLRALTGEKPSCWPQRSPKWGAGEGSTPGGSHWIPSNAGTGSPACEVFGVSQAGQPWGASSHRAGELPGNLGAGYRRDAENPAWGRRRGT